MTKRWFSGLAAVALIWVLLLPAGCLTQTGLHEIPRDHRPALHAVHGARLAKKMQAIHGNYRKAHRLPIRQMQARRFRNLEHCAEAIARYAAELPDLANVGRLGADDRATFERLARQLKINAESLRSAAEAEDRALAVEAWSRMTSTCNSCHAAFREGAGGSTQGGS